MPDETTPPVPVKRGRGRPRKPKVVRQRKPPKRITAAHADRLIELIREGYPISIAARHLGFDATAFTKRTGNSYQAKHPEFADEVAQARHEQAESWEHNLTKRAFEGIEEPVTSQGQLVLNPDGSPMMKRRFFPTDAYFMLKGAMPEKYRDNARVEHTGAEGAPLFTFDPDALTVDELKQLKLLLEKSSPA